MAEEVRIPPASKERWLLELALSWRSRHDILEWVRIVSEEISPYLRVPTPDIFLGVRVHHKLFGKFDVLYEWREKRILVGKDIMDKLIKRAGGRFEFLPERGEEEILLWIFPTYESVLEGVRLFLKTFFITYEFYIEHIKKGDVIVDEWLGETDIPYHERESTKRALMFANEMTDRFIKHAWKYEKWYDKRVKRKIFI